MEHERAAEKRCKDLFYDGLRSPKQEPYSCQLSYRNSGGKITILSVGIDLAEELSNAARAIREARDRGESIPDIPAPRIWGLEDEWQKEL